MAQDRFSDLPVELVEKVFRYMTVKDLCHVALCSRSWRELANVDALWRPLCRQKGLEAPFQPHSQEQETGEGGPPAAFPADAVVTASDWPRLADTCKWKEVYMKAHHLEGNWRNNRCYISSLEFHPAGYIDLVDRIPDPEPHVCDMAGEGDCLAVGISIGTMQIWDLSSCKCLHLIQLDVSEAKGALKMKDDIIAVGCKDGKIRTYSAKTGEQLQVMSGHRLAVSQLFFDGDTIVSTTHKDLFFRRSRKKQMYEDSDCDIRIWSAADGCCRHILQSGSPGLLLVDLDYKDKMVAGAYQDNTIRVWNASSGSRIQQYTYQTRNRLLSCHLGDGIVFSAYDGNVAKVWSLESGECIKTLNVLGGDLESAESYTFNGELLVSLSNDGHMRLLDLEGNFLGDSRYQKDRPPINDLFNFRAIAFRGSKLVVAEVAGSKNLWLVSQDGFHLIKELRPMMYDDEVRTKYSVAWMSETKLAFVMYIDYESYERGVTEQSPSIIVHHYW